MKKKAINTVILRTIAAVSAKLKRGFNLRFDQGKKKLIRKKKGAVSRRLSSVNAAWYSAKTKRCYQRKLHICGD